MIVVVRSSVIARHTTPYYATPCKDLMNDDAASDIDGGGPSGGGLGSSGLLQNPALMGEQSADIVVGALRKARQCAHRNLHPSSGKTGCWLLESAVERSIRRHSDIGSCV